MARPRKYLPELRERAVRLVFEHAGEYPSQWAAIRSVAEKISCANEVLRRWVRQAERDTGHRLGLTTDEHHRLKQLERENVELKRANEILRKAGLTHTNCPPRISVRFRSFCEWFEDNTEIGRQFEGHLLKPAKS